MEILPMKMIWLSSAVLLLSLACSSGENRRGGDTGMADSASGGLSSHDTMPMAGDSGGGAGNTSVTPEGVLSQMNVANTTEIELGTVAAKKAGSAQVKQIARKLVTD